MSEWHPIETAPKDGTFIDLFVDGSRETNCSWGGLDWEITYLGWPAESVGWRTWYERDGDYARVSDKDPTHWMPLPDPPKSIDGSLSDASERHNP